MQVAHFIQRFPPALGGSEAYFHRLSCWLQERGHNVTVWTSTALDLGRFWCHEGRKTRAGIQHDATGLTIRRYDPSLWFARRHMLKLLSYLPQRWWQCHMQTHNPISLRMAIDSCWDRSPCDVVHGSALPYGWPLICAWRLARRHKVPFLLTPFMHFGDPADPRDRTRQVYCSKAMVYLLQAADAIFVQTELESQEVQRLGIPASRIVLQGMGVDPAECTGGSRQRARDQWHVEPGACVIGHLATLSKAKGTVDLLRAARLAWNNGASFTVVIAGSPLQDFWRFWQDFDAKERVRFLGRLSNADKLDFYAGIDAFCLPSRSDSFGLVLVEAWANGKPVIGYRAGGIAELIHHGRDGLLVDCGDRAALAVALHEMEQHDRREPLGRAGLARVPHEFNWDDKLQCVLRQMHFLSGKKNPQARPE